MKDSDGKSLLLKLSNLDHLYQYCCNMMAGASQNQWFEVTGVSICIYVQEPESNIDYEHDELSQIHKPVIISDFEIPKIPETGNRNSDEFLKTLENNMLSDHISPEILKFNICSDNSNVFKENNEVHFDEGIMDNESDVEILSSSEMFYDFRPLNTFSKRKLCTIVKIPTKKISKLVTSNIYNMGSPSATKTITGDGNCLFRAISYALSNRQEYFGTLRKAIIDHLMTNAEMFKSFLQPRFKTVEEHIQTLRMEEGNVWGTELEIIACADLLKTDIYTFFNNSWIIYSASQICINSDLNNQAIYLKHLADINHYEVVTAVTQKSTSRLQSNIVISKKNDIDRKSDIATKKSKIDKKSDDIFY
ncbi:unnamed protein product [Mytilus coruscus]|uniref:OTU domain-containing protein n=1 Tax=Mytilus coruscus TaxID=42192 RepID=A0A6J8C736_MYTCO|nr:unnamed protein product [Mytilus coruscus]